MPEPTLDVRCGGTVHRLRCESGRVALDDHPDLDAERALVALGGEAPECLRRHDLWEQAVADGGFLDEWVPAGGLAPARRSWLTTAFDRSLTEGFQEYLRHLPFGRAIAACRFLLTFPPEWLDAAAVEVARRVCDGRGVVCDHAAANVDEAIAQRLRRAFAISLAHGTASLGFAALVPLRVTVACGARPEISGILAGRNSLVAITVDRTWLSEVWGTGTAVRDGHLVLGRSRDETLVVRWTLSGSVRRPVVGAVGDAGRAGDGAVSLTPAPSNADNTGGTT